MCTTIVVRLAGSRQVSMTSTEITMMTSDILLQNKNVLLQVWWIKQLQLLRCMVLIVCFHFRNTYDCCDRNNFMYVLNSYLYKADWSASFPGYCNVQCFILHSDIHSLHGLTIITMWAWLLLWFCCACWIKHLRESKGSTLQGTSQHNLWKG